MVGIKSVPSADQASGIDPLRTVHNSVYTPQAFELERERVLSRVWLFVCHESELPAPGHFRTTEAAGDSIIVVRRLGGALGAYHNVCRHRGCMVVAEQAGISARFQCPYHHWLYSLDGALVGVPGEDAYAGTGFARENFGLVPARVEAAYGLVFVCLDAEAPSLAEYLGPEVLAILERPLGRARYALFHEDVWVVNANWKGFAENGRDGYHVPYVHESFLARGSPPLGYELYPTGHALQRLSLAPEAVDPTTWHETTRFPLPGLTQGEGWLVNVFPDLVVTARSNVVETLSQVALTHDQTRYEVRVLGLADDTSEQRAVRQRSFETWMATQQPEDQHIMELQQRGLRSRSVRTSVIARGADATRGLRGDDNRLRQFWQVWRQLMGVEANAVAGA